MYTAYVSHQSSLACENELQRVLACEGHNHKLQLQYELLAVEFGCSASQLRQYHSAFQLYIPTTLDSDLVRFELVIKVYMLKNTSHLDLDFDSSVLVFVYFCVKFYIG